LRHGSGTADLLGYARVSTTEQNPDLQVDGLTLAGCWKVWTDHASGVLDRWPQLDAVLEQLRPGDTLVVWRLDRCSGRWPNSSRRSSGTGRWPG